MAKAQRKSRKANPARIRTAPARLHPLIAAADVTPEFRRSADLDVDSVPNPHGEVIIGGQLRQHVVVRRRPAYATLHRQGVIDRATLGALEWFADRWAVANCGIVKSGLGNIGGAGGGSTASHIPVTEATISASRDVDWALGLIGEGLPRRAFLAVMVDEDSFSASARRERAGVHVRASVRRLRAQWSAAFKLAAQALLEGWREQYGARSGRIAAQHYEADPAALDAWRAIEAERNG